MPVRGPVQRTPPRKQEDEPLNNSAVKDDQKNTSGVYDYNSNTKSNVIERSEKIRRSPVNPKRNFTSLEVPPPNISDRQFSSPISDNQMMSLNEPNNYQDYTDDDVYEGYSPAQRDFSSRSPKTFQHKNDTSELINFADRVDDLLCDTRNRLDDIIPQQDYVGGVQNERGSKFGFYQMAQANAQNKKDPQHDSLYPQVNPMSNLMMSPNMMQPMYNQPPHPMAYYGPMPMNQNMMPMQGNMQPGMYPPHSYNQNMNQENMGQMSYPPQMMSQPQMQPGQMPMGNQQYYPMYYPQPTQQNMSSHPGQFSPNQYQ